MSAMDREREVVSSLEKLSTHLTGLDAASQLGQQRLQHYLRVLGSHIVPLDWATDEFVTMHKAKRRLPRQLAGESDAEKVAALGTRLDELHQKMRSPALADLLRNRWALLYVLTTLAQSKPESGHANGSLSTSFDTLDCTSLFPVGGVDTSGASTLASVRSASRNPRPLPTRDAPRTPSREQAESSLNSSHMDGHTPAALTTSEDLQLLRDCLYVFQGINGQHLRYEPISGNHVLDPSLRISPSKKDAVLRMAELGWLFRRVSAYAEKGVQRLGETGLVGQAFYFVLQDELTEYYRTIALMETELNDQSGTASHDGRLTPGLTLRRLLVWAEEPLDHLRLLAMLCDSVEVVRGGAMTSVLYTHTKQGDPLRRQIMHRILGRVCAPIFDMIRRWILEGELVDRWGEFFVEVKEDVADHDERLWHHKYTLRPAMLPKFVPESLAVKILVIGKSINFMRRCCKDKEWVSSRLKAKMETEQPAYGNMQALYKVVDSIAEVVDERLTQLIRDRYNLMTHLRALKKFLVLGQGDFVTCLMDLLGPELKKISTQVFRHDLTGKLEAALRSSNAQFEHPDILNRVHVRLLEASPGEEGWEVFSLEYHVDAPVSAIIHNTALDSYSRMFHLLWRVKRVEWTLSNSWKEHMLVAHSNTHKELPTFDSILHRCNLIRGEMVHFVTNLSSYMMFEVLETSWTALQEELKAAKDMDGMIRAHDAYLHGIMMKAFVADDKAAIHSELRKVLSAILEFCHIHDDLCRETMQLNGDRRDFLKVVDDRTRRGQWGTSQDEEDARQLQSRRVLERYWARVDATTKEYGTSREKLMQMLAQQETTLDAVTFLNFRLDFNEYYRVGR